jgi:hypothetical protein
MGHFRTSLSVTADYVISFSFPLKMPCNAEYGTKSDIYKEAIVTIISCGLATWYLSIGIAKPAKEKELLSEIAFVSWRGSKAAIPLPCTSSREHCRKCDGLVTIA